MVNGIRSIRDRALAQDVPDFYPRFTHLKRVSVHERSAGYRRGRRASRPTRTGTASRTATAIQITRVSTTEVRAAIQPAPAMPATSTTTSHDAGPRDGAGRTGGGSTAVGAPHR